PTVNGATSNSLNITLNAETPVENPSNTTYSIYCTTTIQYVQANGTLGSNEVFQTKSVWGTKTVTGLLNSKEYCFYAKAKNGNGDIRFNIANSGCATTLQGPVISAPAALAASGITQTSFTANWNASSTATGYRLDIALDNTFASFVAGYNNKDVGNVTTLQVTGLTAGTTYYYRVKAYNTGGTSVVSNTINVSTLSNLNAAALTIGNSSGSAGSSISIPVSATKFVDVVGFQFTIVYDKTKLDYVNCSNWSGGTNVSDVLVTSLANDGKITFIYNGAAINIADGKFFDLNFTIKSSATGSAALSWSDNPTTREISNSQSQEIPCTYNNGTLSIVIGFNLTGKLIYENTAQTPLSNISISLLNTNSQSVGSSITDATGSFSFPGLSNGNYSLKPDVKIPWGGASAMDITSYKKHIGNLSQLSPVQVKSGDVNGSNSLSSIDLTIIKQRIGAQISSFTTGDWVYDPVTANINGTNLVQNIKALCYGDANGSYTSSSLKSVSNIFLDRNDKISLLRNGEFEIPFILNKAVDKLSSVTLAINYPAELFDVKDIKMIANNEDLYYSVKDGKINVVYSTLNSISLKEGDLLMTIQFSLKKDASQAIANDNHLVFSGPGEFGDYDDKVLDDVKLIYSTFDVNTLIDEFRKDEIKVYPNPATNLLTVTNVNDTRINILDMLGRSLMSVNCQSNSIDLNIRNLIPGTYTLKVNKNNEIIYRKFTVVR
ncbi:MAG: cohesin domain-containing protein, partial [Candidatus Methanoperedens sp.]|nr:cohesin domain-containing protein [Candidatus Methanoperedens sp.]